MLCIAVLIKCVLCKLFIFRPFLAHVILLSLLLWYTRDNILMLVLVFSWLPVKNDEEIGMLRSNPKIWNVHSVLNVLHSLVDKSNINQQLEVYSSGRYIMIITKS